MNKKIFIGTCMIILLAITTYATIDDNTAKTFRDLKTKLDQGQIKEDKNAKDTLKTLAYLIVDDEMSSRIQQKDPKAEETIKLVIEYKQELVQRNMLYNEAPKTWALIKAFLPGESEVYSGLDPKGKDIGGTYKVRVTPEDGTTHFLPLNQNMIFRAETDALQGNLDKVNYCWIDEGIEQKEGLPEYNFRKPMEKPEGGVYYTLELKVLKNAETICDPKAAIIAQFQWKIQVGKNTSKYASTPKIAKYIPEEDNLLRYKDESTKFIAVVENENNQLKYEWRVDNLLKGAYAGNSFFLDKCDKINCEVSVTVKEGTTQLGTKTWKITTADEKIKVPIFPDIPIFPKDEIVLVATQNGNKLDYTIKITDKFYQYYDVINNYEWDFNGDLVYDRTTTTKTTSYDYSTNQKGTYKITVKVPIVLNDAAKREIDQEELKKNPIMLQVHYAQAQTDVTVEGKTAEPKEKIISEAPDCGSENKDATTCKCEGEVRTKGICCKGIWNQTITSTTQCPSTAAAPAPRTYTCTGTNKCSATPCPSGSTNAYPGRTGTQAGCTNQDVCCKPATAPAQTTSAGIKKIQEMIKKYKGTGNTDGILDPVTVNSLVAAKNNYPQLKSIDITNQRVIEQNAGLILPLLERDLQQEKDAAQYFK